MVGSRSMDLQMAHIGAQHTNVVCWWLQKWVQPAFERSSAHLQILVTLRRTEALPYDRTSL